MTDKDLVVVTGNNTDANSPKRLKGIAKLPIDNALNLSTSGTLKGVIGYNGATSSSGLFYKPANITELNTYTTTLSFGGHFAANGIYSNGKRVVYDTTGSGPFNLSMSDGVISTKYYGEITNNDKIFKEKSQSFVGEVDCYPVIDSGTYFPGGNYDNLNKGVVLNSIMHVGGLAVYSNQESLSYQKKHVTGSNNYIAPTIITNIYYDDDLD